MMVWELVGTVIGAGLASGREIASFFSRFNGWSIPGVIVSACLMAFLAGAELPEAWMHSWKEKLWTALLQMLLVATGGAMLAGAGEIFSLVLPIQWAYWSGMIGTFLLAWFLARRTLKGLSLISRMLTAALVAIIVLGLIQKPLAGVRLDKTGAVSALLSAASYGGFNAALQIPVMAASGHTKKERKKSVVAAAAVVALILLLGNAVLLRHPGVMNAPMPFVQMLAAWGKTGFYLSAACLYLAILSTLTACVRGLSGSGLPMVGIVLIALLGFSGVVEVAYPILGGACMMLMLVAKMTNLHRKASFPAD